MASDLGLQILKTLNQVAQDDRRDDSKRHVHDSVQMRAEKRKTAKTVIEGLAQSISTPGQAERLATLKKLFDASPESRALIETLLNSPEEFHFTAGQAAELKLLLKNGKLSDVFGREVQSRLERILVTFETAHGVLPQHVSELLPNFEMVTQAKDLPDRFVAQMQLIKTALFNVPGLSKDEKANRLFELFSKFAEKYVELAAGREATRSAVTRGEQGFVRSLGTKAIASLGADERVEIVKRFMTILESYSLQEVKDLRTQLPAIQLAESLLSLPKADDVRRAVQESSLTAVHVKSGPLSHDEPSSVARNATAADAQWVEKQVAPKETIATTNVQSQQVPGQVVAPVDTGSPRNEFEKRLKKFTDKVLGQNLLFNVLHRFRATGGPDRDDAAQRELLNQIVIIGMLALIFVAIIVIILVNL